METSTPHRLTSAARRLSQIVCLGLLVLGVSRPSHAAPPPNLPAGCITRFQAADSVGFTCLTLDETKNPVIAFCGTSDGKVQTFDCSNGQRLQSFHLENNGKPEPIVSVTLTSTHIVATTRNRVVRWSRQGDISEELAQVESPSAVDQSGKLIASTRNTTPIWITSLGNSSRAWRVDHQVQADQLQFSPDSRWLFSTRFGRLYCWDVATGELTWKRRMASRITGLQLSPSSREIVAATEYGTGYRLMITNGETKSQFGEQQQFPDRPAMAWSPDESLIVITQQDNSLSVVEEYSHHVGLRLPGHTATVSSIQFLSDSMTFVSVDSSGRGFVWNLFDPSLVQVRDEGSQDLTKTDEIVMLWQQLSESDTPQNVWSAIATLKRHPETFYRIMRNPPDGRATISRLITELDHPEYQIRAHASWSLRQFGVLAESALQRASREKRSVESQRRLNRLLLLLGDSRSSETIRHQKADRLRQLRCVHLLSWIGTNRAGRELAETWQRTRNEHVRDEITKVLRQFAWRQWTKPDAFTKLKRTLASQWERVMSKFWNR
ncbi:WD40 repeat domain-containing protein [Thalassoroseus pseudoceratinae]|uniref:WD40 repeat domain-containing protein n=1 Tax=Thalassoroseus pseudoceratinae TaxID=2713176 RepID=UPI001423F06A|nr:WD40 repeat domain-containing protein [Thalassoroseus pseudoceratinae]